MKKLINAPRTVVPDMLRGLATTDERLLLVPSLDVVVRADYLDLLESGQVALISGGGAGHEPAHAGYVGKGMLTAAVTGAVFTSPGVDAVLGAIRLVTGDAGCLLIVKNYTGDRLNFGLAAAIARSEGLKVEMVLVDDDVALDNDHSRAGSRGLAGTVLVHKLAGAAAAAGASLADTVELVTDFVSDLGTMGVALSPCTNPSAGKPGFELGETEIEYGLGIHGERGASREQIAPADTIAQRLIDRIVETKGFSGQRAVLLVNGLGGTPPSELAIMAGAAITAARAHGVEVERVTCGTLLSALEMAGCSLTLAKLDDKRLALLDEPSAAPAWIGLTRPVSTLAEIDEPAMPASDTDVASHPISSDHRAILQAAIKAVADALLAAESELTALDSEVGDGDLGISLARGAEAVLANSDTLDCSHPAAALREISTIIRRSVGGTSGPLYAAFVLAASQSLRGAGSALSLSGWAAALREGCTAISELGGAQRGDSTMLDALLPAADALDDAANAKREVTKALDEALGAAREGVRSTASLNPRVGRASYVGDRAVGHVDPGAEAVTIWLEAIRRSMT